MLVRVVVCGALALVALMLTPVAPAGAAAPNGSRAEPPFWMSKTIRARIDQAGSKGVSLTTIRMWVRQGAAGRSKRKEPVTADPCVGVQPARDPDALQANACQTYPHGCTANFIYHYGPGPVAPVSDGRNHFIGVAGHCVDHANQTVYMQKGQNPVVVAVGKVFKLLRSKNIGNDFAVVRINEGIDIEPQTPIGGPRGIYTGCAPRGVAYWGHGYGVAVGQGKAEGGLATHWFEREFAWVGVALPGDSGSGVIVPSSREAAGVLTHLVIDPARYGPAVIAGTRVTRALTFLGANFHLVNEDFSTSRATMADTTCGNSNVGAGV